MNIFCIFCCKRMVMSSLWFRLLPLLLSFSAFILVMLALFAGNKPGVLEGYDIITVNTSSFGTNENAKSQSQTDDHIPDFYSLYALAVCEGDYSADGSRILTECHPLFSNDTSTIPSLLTTTHDTSLSDTDLPPPLESNLSSLDTLLKAVAVLLSTGIAFTGLSFLASIPALSLGSNTLKRVGYTWSVWTNLVFVSLALFFLILGGLVAAAGAKVAEGKVNDLGGDVGVGAVAGRNWVALTWAGIALMVGVLLYWVGRVVRLRRKNGGVVEQEEEELQRGKEEEDGVRMSSQLPRFERLPRSRTG